MNTMLYRRLSEWVTEYCKRSYLEKQRITPSYILSSYALDGWMSEWLPEFTSTVWKNEAPSSYIYIVELWTLCSGWLNEWLVCGRRMSRGQLQRWLVLASDWWCIGTHVCLSLAAGWKPWEGSHVSLMSALGPAFAPGKRAGVII